MYSTYIFLILVFAMAVLGSVWLSAFDEVTHCVMVERFGPVFVSVESSWVKGFFSCCFF